MKAYVTLVMLLLFSTISLAQCKRLEEAKKQPREVTKLDLSGCSLHTFPADVLKMKNLKTLYLGPSRMIMYRADAGSPIKGNLFKQLPENFGKLKSLEVLDLQATDLRTIPQSFEKLQALKELDLSFNPRLDPAILFEVLPSLESLELLNLTGCNFDKETSTRLEQALPETSCIFDNAQNIARD